MKKKQLLTLLLTGILFVTTCCSCGNSSATADSDSKQADTADKASTADTQDTSEASDERKSISLLFTKNAISMPIKEMKTITDTEELCNVDLEIIEVPDEGADEKISLMINTGDLPDVFMEGVSASTILNYQGQDVFIPVTEYITPEIMPNLYSILEKKPEYPTVKSGDSLTLKKCSALSATRVSSASIPTGWTPLAWICPLRSMSTRNV